MISHSIFIFLCLTYLNGILDGVVKEGSLGRWYETLEYMAGSIISCIKSKEKSLEAMETSVHRPPDRTKLGMFKEKEKSQCGWIIVEGSREAGDEIGEVGGNEITHGLYRPLFRAREFCKWAMVEREHFSSHYSNLGEGPCWLGLLWLQVRAKKWWVQEMCSW